MSNMELAIDSALHGPERKKLKILGHHFNVKPAEITRSGSRVTADGQISHHLRLRPDDQVYYHITRSGNVIKKINMHIVRGGITRILVPLSPLAALFGVPLTPDMVERVGRELGRLADGSWEAACQAIILNIADRL